MPQLWGRTVAELQDLYAAGTRVVDVVSACVGRAAEVEHLGAIVSLSPHAWEQAKHLDAGPVRGPLHGVPVLVKDNLDVAGEVTAAGSPVLQGRQPAAADGVAVARLRAAGAVILGRTSMHEMAWGITSRFGAAPLPVNPHDPLLIAGGSSGGSAAAVSAGVAPIGLGTDTAGSVRIPAAFCGVVGLKGGWEWIPSTGSISLAPSLDSVGALARTLADAQLACEVMAGQSIGVVSIGGLRVGVATDPSWPALAGPCLEAMTHAVEALRAADAVTGEASLVVDGRALTPYELFGVLQQPEALSYHRDVLGTWPSQAEVYGSDTQKRLRMAERMAAHDLSQMQAELTHQRDALHDLLMQHDVVLAPMSAAGPSTVADPEHVVSGGELVPLRDTVIAFTAVANLARVAAISVPTGVLDEHGIPVGVQLIEGAGGLPALLGAARVVMGAASTG